MKYNLQSCITKKKVNVKVFKIYLYPKKEILIKKAKVIKKKKKL